MSKRAPIASVASLLSMSLTATDAKAAGINCQSEIRNGGGGQHKTVAAQNAIGAWSKLAVAEYGPHYGEWRLSADKRVRCDVVPFNIPFWHCKASGRPCSQASP